MILFLTSRGALASRMLLALICDPEQQTQNTGSLIDCEVSCYLLLTWYYYSLKSVFSVTVVLCLQALLSEYLDAACSLLSELLLLGHEVSWDDSRLLLLMKGCRKRLLIWYLLVQVSNIRVQLVTSHFVVTFLCFRPADVPLLTTSCLLDGSSESCSLTLTW